MHWSYVLQTAGERPPHEAPPHLEGLGVLEPGDLVLLHFAEPVRPCDAAEALRGGVTVLAADALSEAHLKLWAWLATTEDVESGEVPRSVLWVKRPRQLVASSRMWRVTPGRCRELADSEERRAGGWKSEAALVTGCARALGEAFRLPFEKTAELTLEEASRRLRRRVGWGDLPSELRWLGTAQCGTCELELELDASEPYCSPACEARRCRCGGVRTLRARPRDDAEASRRQRLVQRLAALRSELGEQRRLATRLDLRSFEQWCREAPHGCGFSANVNPGSEGCADCAARYEEGARLSDLQAGPSEEQREAWCDALEACLKLPATRWEAWSCLSCD
jgi:hypothetical protein